jgi:hypothetical protein
LLARNFFTKATCFLYNKLFNSISAKNKNKTLLTVCYIFFPEKITCHITNFSRLTVSITETWSALALPFQVETLLSDVVLALLPIQYICGVSVL